MKLQKKLVNYKMPLSKRVFDLIVSISALIILSPILLITALAVKLESKGEIFYISRRIGYKQFNLYKFRSMYKGAENELNKLAKVKNLYVSKKVVTDFSELFPIYSKLTDEKRYRNHQICNPNYNTPPKKMVETKPAFIKIADDPRITKVGKFIRDTGIDELPQLINVIKGEMSIVGNRPLSVDETRILMQKSQKKRFMAPAGITGLWQVKSYRENILLSEDERIRFDNEYADRYINNYCFWYDLKLILHTIPIIWKKLS